MSVEVIKEGDKGKQGNAECPQCGEVVLIDEHFGNLATCPHCKVPYVPKLVQPKYR